MVTLLLVTAALPFAAQRFKTYENPASYDAFKVSVLIDYGNGSISWYNGVILPEAANVFNATLAVAIVNYTYYPVNDAIIVDAINGVWNSPPFYWNWFYWNFTESQWLMGSVASNQYTLNYCDIIAWHYQNTESPSLPRPPPSRTITVDDNGPADFHVVQEAINAANPGDAIYVYDGTYYENVVVNKTVSLIGENKSNTIIDGNGVGPMGTVWLQSDNSSITGFTIRNGEYGVRISGSIAYFPRFTGHRIEDNCIVENLYGAICLQTCANNTISNNIIENNTLFGIHIWSSANNTIINNTVVNNGHGIDFYGNSNDNILRNNNMTDNTYNFGLILRGETVDWEGAQSGNPGIIDNVDNSNRVNGKPIYCLVNQSNAQVPTDAGYVWLNNCTNITVNGCELSHNLQGVLLLFCKNVSIINSIMTANAYGIYVGIYSDNTTIVGNTLENNSDGIYLDDFSRFTTMRNNAIGNGDMNFGVSPDIGHYISDLPDLANDVDTSNTVDGKPIIYWMNKHDEEVPTDAGYVMLIDSTNILIEGLNLSNNVQSILLLGSNNTVIAKNSVTDSIYGIDVNEYGWVDHEAEVYRSFCSFNTTVEGNTVLDNGVGIRVIGDDNTISNNTLYRNPLGILADTSNSVISGNLVVASDFSGWTNPGPELSVFHYPEWPWEFSKELMQAEIGGIIVGGGFNVIYANILRDSFFGLVMYDAI
jgi:parallel beta-helix repeat protein